MATRAVSLAGRVRKISMFIVAALTVVSIVATAASMVRAAFRRCVNVVRAIGGAEPPRDA